MAQPAPAKMRINAEAVARARVPETAAVNPFVAAKPMPGVLPADEPTMAQDDAISQSYAYAAQSGAFVDGMAWLGYAHLSQLAQLPEYRRISEIRAQEMTRKWIKLHSTGDDDKIDRIKALDAALKKFKVQDVFRRAAEIDGLFGRAQIYIDTGYSDDAAELRTPLAIDAAKIPKGGLKRLSVIEPIWTYPNDYNSTEPLKPGYYKPRSWFVQGKLVHASRLLTIISREMPDLLKPAYNFGGLALSQMARPYVENWLRTRQSVSDLLHSFSTMILSTDLSTLLAPGSGSDLAARGALFNATRDNNGLMIVNKETETLSNVVTPLSGLDALQAQAQEQMASVSATPLVKLLGVTPSGLNASSDGEIRVFYDSTQAASEELFTDPLRAIIDIIQLSEFGEIDPDIGFTYVSLWALDDQAIATIRKTNADTDAVYIEQGVISPEDVRKRLAAEEGGSYSGLDVADVPEVPDPAMEGEPTE